MKFLSVTFLPDGVSSNKGCIQMQGSLLTLQNRTGSIPYPEIWEKKSSWLGASQRQYFFTCQQVVCV